MTIQLLALDFNGTRRSSQLRQNIRDVGNLYKQFVCYFYPSHLTFQAPSKASLVVIITDLNICCYQPALQLFIKFKVALSMLKAAINKLYWQLSPKQFVVGLVVCLQPTTVWLLASDFNGRKILRVVIEYERCL
eukprot:TRINITY_DN1830_c1_g1_i1.p3 TRINITY_DN1830_c1_g1~~TRINITY_DN1830_c1_g1_i1.p3  ORF type:complete len:134 (-),score=5.90 TRINITY_DN1830_c1_g1_i1:73-474(-)